MVIIAKKAGRPRLNWDDAKVREFKLLVAKKWSRREISAFFGIDEKTLNRLIDENLHDEFRDPGDTTPVTFSDVAEQYDSLVTGYAKSALAEAVAKGDIGAAKWWLAAFEGISDRQPQVVIQEQPKSEEATPLDDITSRYAQARGAAED